MPEYYDFWSSVYIRFRRWQKAGVWDQILEKVSIEPDFKSVMIEATIVRAGANGGHNFRLWDDLEAD